jgi:hypothetical protein
MSTPFSFIRYLRAASRAVVLTVSMSSARVCSPRKPLVDRHRAKVEQTERVNSSEENVELCRAHIWRMGNPSDRLDQNCRRPREESRDGTGCLLYVHKAS